MPWTIGHDVLNNGITMVDFSAISQLAYELWEKGGRRDGTAGQNWLEAERILAGRAGIPQPAAPLSRARKTRGKSPAKPTAKSSAKPATVETPKVGSSDAPGG